MIYKQISKKIKLERTKLGLSQLDLAIIAKLNINTIWKIENEKIIPTIKTIEKIAKALNMDLMSFFDFSKIKL